MRETKNPHVHHAMVRRLLSRQMVFVRAPSPFEEINIEEDPEAADFVARANEGRSRVPAFDVGGRVFHCSPYDPAKLSLELGF